MLTPAAFRSTLPRSGRGTHAEKATLAFSKAPPIGAAGAGVEQTSPDPSGKPCKFQLVGIGACFAIFGPLPTFKMPFQVHGLNPRGASNVV